MVSTLEYKLRVTEKSDFLMFLFLGLVTTYNYVCLFNYFLYYGSKSDSNVDDDHESEKKAICSSIDVSRDKVNFEAFLLPQVKLVIQLVGEDVYPKGKRSHFSRDTSRKRGRKVYINFSFYLMYR